MSIAAIEHKVINVLAEVGKDFAKGLAVASKYLVPAASLASLLFPGEAGTAAVVVNSVELIQNAVAEVEQKYTASGIAKSSETNAQKLADVLALVSPTVTSLLASEGIKIDQATLTNIVNAVVAILKVQVVPVA